MPSESPPSSNKDSSSDASTNKPRSRSRARRPSSAVPPSQQLAAPATPVVRVEGLAETLHDVRHELGLISHATKYNWINQRLILLRNGLIALSIFVVVVVAAVACYREAYRQTLTIVAFDVPSSLAESGITGHVVAKVLFD